MLATAAFWAIVLMSPPVSEASVAKGFGIQELMAMTPWDLPTIEADAF